MFFFSLALKQSTLAYLSVRPCMSCLSVCRQLPDDTVIKVGRERFQAPEVLFNPQLLELECMGLFEAVFHCINQCDVDCRPELYQVRSLLVLLLSLFVCLFADGEMCALQHIVLSGGTSMLPGLPSRLDKDIRQLYLERILKGRKEGLKVRGLL